MNSKVANLELQNAHLLVKCRLLETRVGQQQEEIVTLKASVEDLQASVQRLFSECVFRRSADNVSSEAKVQAGPPAAVVVVAM